MSAFKQSMRKLGIRAGLLAGTSLAVVAIAGVGASGAAAAVPCLENTVNIQGKGASLQKEAQALLTGREVMTTLPKATELPTTKSSGGYAGKCSAANNNTVTYTSTGSGPGLEAFGFTGAGLSLQEQSLAFIGTDDAPTSTQIASAETASGTKPVIFPVAETSIAVVFRPPAGCTLKGESTKGITWLELNKIFAGTLKKWSELSAASGTCETEITRVVRAEGSGTTYQFKNYLSKLETEKSAVGPGCEAELGKKTWADLRPIETGGAPNTTWPKCTGTTPLTTAAGGGAVVKAVATTAGTIGYASLPDAKSSNNVEGKAQIAWLQNSEVKGVKEFAPAFSETKANCSKRSYEVPTLGQVGSGHTGIAVDWSTVFGAQPSVGGGLYPLCTLTFDVGWDTYSEAKYGATAAAKGNTVKEYELNWVLQAAQQTELEKKYYFALPSSAEPKFDVLGAAKLAAEHIN